MTRDPSSSQPPLQACLVFDSDSQYFACRNLVSNFLDAGWGLKFVVVGNFEPLGTGIPGIGIVRVSDMEEVCQLPEVMSSDALGAYLPGSKLRRLWRGVDDWFSGNGTRPLLFTGYNGLVLRLFEDGLSWRSGYDLIALNSPEDHLKAAAFGDHSTLKRSALMPIIGIDRTNKSPVAAPDASPSWQEVKQIVFAEQVLFPKSNAEKFYLYTHLIRIALTNPDWQIVIKPRTLPGNETFHRQEEHISTFIRQRFILPENLRIRYDPLDEILRASTALLSISSTAFFDALGLEIPSFTLSDFGISSAYGTHFFHGSGCSLCLSDITTLSHDLFRTRPSEEWLEFKGFSSQFSPASVVAGLNDLLATDRFKTAPAPFDPEQRLLVPPARIPPEFLTFKMKVAFFLLDQAGRSPRTFRRSIARLRRKSVNLIRERLGGASEMIGKEADDGGSDTGRL